MMAISIILVLLLAQFLGSLMVFFACIIREGMLDELHGAAQLPWFKDTAIYASLSIVPWVILTIAAQLVRLFP